MVHRTRDMFRWSAFYHTVPETRHSSLQTAVFAFGFILDEFAATQVRAVIGTINATHQVPASWIRNTAGHVCPTIVAFRI